MRERVKCETPPEELFNKYWLDKREYEIKCSDFKLDLYEDSHYNCYEVYYNEEVLDLPPWELFDTKKECIEFHLENTQEKIVLLKSIEYKLLSQKY